ncbi:SIP domain-containing protein [Nocardioides sp. AE5]|uniref:SIP domain-containing protein n=1 Tax=Nocardioides sp. AE5 TaxID=2962573 RepID=UPI0028826458|nr:SIP domain-containing protein [Nocardioides sp. AE5]MDT0200349.1 SIP domain-containing protein [Nocardioides sp. AE5]
MRRRPRKSSIDQVLIAGTATDLPAIRQVLLMLPDDIYGQVYVEAPEAAWTTLPCPPRVTVAWLPMDDQPRAATATTAWLAEWMPEEPQSDREFSLWVGAGISGQIGTLCHRLDIELGVL